MFLENAQVEVGRTSKNERSKGADAACFSLTVLIVLLHKYSSRLFDEVKLKLRFGETALSHSIELQFAIGEEQTFHSLYNLVRKDLQKTWTEAPGQCLAVEWITESDQVEPVHRIKLGQSPSRRLYDSRFSSDPHSFFHDLFKKSARHYKMLAENAIALPNRPVADLEYCSEKDVKEIESVAYGPIDEHISFPEYVDKIFDQTVHAYPNRAAVKYRNKSISYQGLSKKVNQLTVALMQRGIGIGDSVGILLPRSVEAYAAMIAIMKCGAAYVPIDPDYPGERVKYILEDSFAKCLISSSEFKNHYSLYDGAVLNTDLELKATFSKWDHHLLHDCGHIERSTTDPAYLIYTSGSSGQPKGVVVSHAAASNLIKAEKAIFHLKPSDKVAQGFSIAFDASIEEIWLAFASGAALFPVDHEIMCSGAAIKEFINRQKITVFSTVPTLLSIIPPQLTSLRLLILGGESCTKELIQTWSNKKCRLVNTYGPTEATVITTATDCKRDKRITIGKPIPNSAIFITDSLQKPVPAGVPGELCIAGYGLANGYQNKIELTEEKFITPSFDLHEQFPKRIYRSGDLARINADREIEFLGRIDNQVKIRGYRVELTEIEAQIIDSSGIKNVLVAVRNDSLKGDFLVAYIVPEDKAQPLSITRLKKHLRGRLAPYMVPSHFVQLEEIPLLPSGKIDRKKIDTLPLEAFSEKNTSDELLNETEQIIHQVWKKYFGQQYFSKTDDFFLDLGGHSFLAAKTVSELRQQTKFKKLSVLDVYKNPSIEKLAMQFHSKEKVNGKPSWSKVIDKEKSNATGIRHLVCGILQFFSYYFVFGFNLVRDLSLYACFFYLYSNGYSLGSSIGWSVVSSVVSYPLTIASAIGAKWVLLGRIKAGRYRLWGGFYLRWWLVRKLFQLLDLYHLAGTPLLPLVYRSLGMTIGKDVHLETDHFAAFDLIQIGDGTSIDEGATINGFSVKNGWLITGKIGIGAYCYVGTSSVVCENTVMEDGARLEDLSLIPSGTKVPAGETWSGSPARSTSKVNCTEVVNPPAFSKWYKIGASALYSVLLSLTPIVTAIAFVPGIFLLMKIDAIKEFWMYLAILPIVGASFVILLAIEIVVLKWVLVGKVKPGVYAVHGGFYIRNWFVDQLLRTSLDHVGQLHATLYVTSWYRLLGMKIGSMVELSTAASTTPDLVRLDEGATIADEVSLGSPHVEKGWMILAPVHMGYRSFAGNSSVIPEGTRMGDQTLVGVLSIAPKREDAERPGATWFGSPPILFPKREKSENYSEQKTYHPPRKLRLQRAAFELLRITLPPAAFIIVMSFIINTGLMLEEYGGLLKTIVVLPVLFGVCCCVMVLIVALIKWVVIGRYKPFSRPLWTNFIWRLEFVNGLYEFFASPLLLDLLQGTPFLVWYLRLMGSKIGNACYIDTTGFLEWDLVSLGDRVAINQNAVMQTHLFEDRVLKASKLVVGNDCTIGTTSVLLYDSEMKEGSQLDDLSLLMKGEILPEQTHWMGIPAIESGQLIEKQPILIKPEFYEFGGVTSQNL